VCWSDNPSLWAYAQREAHLRLHLNRLKGKTMATRKLKPTIVDIPVIPHPTVADMLNQVNGTVGISWQRSAIGLIAGILVALGFGYVVGVITSTLILAALTLTGSAFVAVMILFIGIVVSFYFGGVVGATVSRAVATSTLLDSVRGWFDSSAIKPVAA